MYSDKQAQRVCKLKSAYAQTDSVFKAKAWRSHPKGDRRLLLLCERKMHVVVSATYSANDEAVCSSALGNITVSPDQPVIVGRSFNVATVGNKAILQRW